MKQRKPFSILKWLVFPSLTLALAATIAWFNVRAFGWEDGAVYLGVVAAITLFSIAINKYVKLIDDDDPTNDRLAVTAFVFEIILTVALIINAAYSLSVQREMSVARQREATQGKNLETVTKLRSRGAQREATRMLREQGKDSRNSQVIFAENERPLFWIMVGELLAYGVAAFSLLAVSSLTGRKTAFRSAPQSLRIDRGEDFPDEVDADAALRPSRQPRGNFATVATDGKAIETLKEHLRAVAFTHPGRWYKVDPVQGGVIIRLMGREKGRPERTIAQTRQSNKILAAVSRPDFRERLIEELKACGFPIGGE